MQPAHRRTAAEAVVQAEAKARIRAARNVRRTGFWLPLLGAGLIVRPWWSVFSLGVGIHIHDGPSFVVAAPVLLGVCLVLASPFVIVTGGVMLRRALAAARNDPVAAQVLDQGDGSSI